MQTEYSLWSREPEAGILHLPRAGGRLCAIQPAWPRLPDGDNYRSGVLAADDFAAICRFEAETMRKNQLLLQRLQQVATRYDATLAQIALAG